MIVTVDARSENRWYAPHFTKIYKIRRNFCGFWVFNFITYS